MNVQPVVPGSSVGLVDPILQSGARHVLFLTGNPHREELEQALEQRGIDVSIFVLYSTSISEPEELPSGACWAVIFSPRGAQAVEKQLSAHPNLRRAAIGPTTALALHELGLPAHAVADFPDPESLFNSISLCH
jgi:uroporphyrinogen-III synthase